MNQWSILIVLLHINVCLTSDCLSLRDAVKREERYLLIKNGMTVKKEEVQLFSELVDGFYGNDEIGWRNVTSDVLGESIWSFSLIKEPTEGLDLNDALLKIRYLVLGSAGQPDFNKKSLSLHWFTDLGLDPGSYYGCAMENSFEYSPLNFASGCDCPFPQHCNYKSIGYVFHDVPHNSSVGVCGCCSWWLIALIVSVPIVLILCFLGFCKKIFTKTCSRIIGGREAASQRYRKVRQPLPTAIRPRQTRIPCQMLPNPLSPSEDSVCVLVAGNGSTSPYSQVSPRVYSPYSEDPSP